MTDVLAFTANADTITVTGEQFGGKVAADYEVSTADVLLTIRPAEWPATEDVSGDTDVVLVDVLINEDRIGVEVTSYEPVSGGDIDITQADVLVSVGRGIEEEENIPLIEDLADALDAVVSARLVFPGSSNTLPG